MTRGDTRRWGGSHRTMTSKMSDNYFKMSLDITRTQAYQIEKNDKNVKK